MKLKKVAVIGMGLIGGSIGKALLKKGLADEVAGVCRRQSSLDRAINEKVLSKGYVNNYGEATANADVVIIATPVHTIKEVLKSLAEVLDDTKVLVTDVGSTKKEIVDFAAGFKEKFSFVGGHPLTGSEKFGVEYAREDLFHGSLCVLTRNEFTREEDIEKLRKLWQALGAEVDVVTPDQHDEILAFTSHLPHVVAYSLVGAQKKEYFKYMSTGFKDTTRIASSSPDIWSDIFMGNRENVLSSIRRFKKLLDAMESDIRENRREDLKKKLETYRKMRDDIS